MIGVRKVVCTVAQVRVGIVTGRIAGKNCHGPEKVERIEDLLRHGLDLDSSIFYSDHHSDLPLLRRVERAVLVNPGLKTRRMLKDFNFIDFG